MKFVTKQRVMAIDQPLICAILNVTPDSFSDGGQHNEVTQAVEKAKELIRQGADMLDIGGESTRPGSTYVEIHEEINRVVPVIQAIREFSDIPISVDTWKAPVAEACLQAGANVINDITGLIGDKAMAQVIAEHDAGLILMFNPVKIRPNHPAASRFPHFGESFLTAEELNSYANLDIVELMDIYFDKALALAEAAHIKPEQIMLDPGIGFGLTPEENLALINALPHLQGRGFLTYLGVSRKRFIAQLVAEVGLPNDYTTEVGLQHVDTASAMISFLATQYGVHAIRVHSVQEHLLARQVALALKENQEMR